MSGRVDSTQLDKYIRGDLCKFSVVSAGSCDQSNLYSLTDFYTAQKQTQAKAHSFVLRTAPEPWPENG
jgi:hypothetical protein